VAERDLDGLRALAREMSGQFETLRRGMADLQRELRAVSVTAKSPDGYVTATVDARGQLRKLQLDPRIYRRPDSAQLAATITETVQQAVTEAAERVKAVSDRIAPGVDVASYLRGDVAQRFQRFDFVEDQVAGGND
jgi:DNA-binding protein YbaB